MADSFTFSLVPADGRVPVDAMQRAIEHILAIVRGVDQTISRDWRRQRIWYVERISSSNPTIQIVPGERPILVHESVFPDTARAVVTGLSALTNGPIESPPPYFAEEELQRLKKLRSVFRSGVARIDTWAGSSDITEQPPADFVAALSEEVGDRVDRILGSGYREYGSIEGELGAIRTRGQPTLTIWDAMHEQAVRCYFARQQVQRIKDLLDHRVRVSGMVHYFSDGRPRRVTEFHGIEDLAPDPLRPRASFGSIPELTGDKDTVDYLRVLRE